MKTRQHVSMAICSVLIGLSGEVSFGQIVADSTFNDPDWNLTLLTKNAGGAVSANQSLTMGNGAPGRLVSHSVNAGTSTAPSTVAGLHINNTAVWNPVVDGLLPGVDFSIDYDFAQPAFGNVGIGALVRQSGRWYAAPLGGFPDPTGGGFATVMDCLIESDFAELDFGTSTPIYNFSSNPDFSATGSPIRFGFMTSNSNSPSNPIAYQRRYIFDNFVAAAKPVPEPGACSMVMLAGMGLALFRRW